MLESVKISRRQSEIRQALAELVSKESPTEDETRSMEDKDKEYRRNETRYRAALVAEDEERREAGKDLETRDAEEWRDLMGRFEVRQVALALDEGRQLDGPTAEIVTDLRGNGGYRGIPVPWEALEMRAGETVASGTPDPVRTLPIIDRIFAESAAARMGTRMIQIANGDAEYPVTTSSVAAGWQSTETGDVAGPTVFATTDRPLRPTNTLGIQMRITRRALKQSGQALEQAVRRDMNGAIGEALDAAVFQGAGSSGEPAGVIADASNYGITSTAVDAAATWTAFRAAIVRFMNVNAISSPSAVRILMRPETWDSLDDAVFEAGAAMTEWGRLTRNIPLQNIVVSNNALAAEATGGADALLTCSPGGVPPIFTGMWGAIDVIRDPYSDAASGGLRLTALATMDVTISRAAQLELLTGVQ